MITLDAHRHRVLVDIQVRYPLPGHGTKRVAVVTRFDNTLFKNYREARRDQRRVPDEKAHIDPGHDQSSNPNI